LDSVHRAGIPPRRAGNFLLSRQKKVTKEEALNRTPLGLRHQALGKQPLGLAWKRPASLSLLSL
jgi:hypothetical protein